MQSEGIKTLELWVQTGYWSVLFYSSHLASVYRAPEVRAGAEAAGDHRPCQVRADFPVSLSGPPPPPLLSALFLPQSCPGYAGPLAQAETHASSQATPDRGRVCWRVLCPLPGTAREQAPRFTVSTPAGQPPLLGSFLCPPKPEQQLCLLPA